MSKLRMMALAGLVGIALAAMHNERVLAGTTSAGKSLLRSASELVVPSAHACVP